VLSDRDTRLSRAGPHSRHAVPAPLTSKRLLMLIPPKIRVNHHVTQLLETRPRLPA